MKMVSLKRTAADIKEEKRERTSVVGEMSAYHYGLTLRLEQEELQKLGMLGKLPPVGTAMPLQVLAVVVGVSEERMADGEQECCLTLQVQQMGMADAAASPAKRVPSIMSKY